VREKREFENPFKLIWPSSLHAKNSACADGQISGSSSRVPPDQEGRFAIVTNVGAGCDGRGCVARRAAFSADGEAVWS